MPEQWAGHRVFHHEKLKKYIPPAFPEQAQRVIPPEPNFVDGEPEYEVTEILGEKKIRIAAGYYRKWYQEKIIVIQTGD